MTGEPRNEFARDGIADVVTKAAGPTGVSEIGILEHYDTYYLDRRRERPLPVMVFQLHDAEHTRYYIDPKTAQVVGLYRSSGWVTRWLYHALHSLDFPFLYDHRPLWDLVVIIFMTGGSALSITALVLAWRVLGVQKLFRMTPAPPL